jgi:CheY-like chemotaxis protein
MTDRYGRVLVLDDLPKWRAALVEILRREGFYAEAVSSTAQVLERMEETFYHILLLDVRLNDADPTNQEGIDLLPQLKKRGLSDAIKVIMISNYGDKEKTRRVFREYGVADFVFKDDFDEEVLVGTVRQVFAEQVSINLALGVHWQEMSSPEQVILNLVVGETRIKNDTPLQDLIACELDDLLCRLFYEANSVLLRPLTPGQSGASVLLAQPFYATGGGRAVVVKFGDCHMIEEEYSNFKKYVQPFVGGGRTTTVLDKRRTPHLGGIVYSLLGAFNDQVEDFGNFYRHSDLSEIKDALDQLFFDTCGAWYANPGQLYPCDLTGEYQQSLGFTSHNLERAFTGRLKSVQLKSEQGKQKLVFKSLGSERVFTNPLLAMKGQSLMRPTYICITHGDFNQHNLLVDRTRHMWLIDFQKTGSDHILRDVAKLDSEVRFQLLELHEATLEERLRMEELLCSIGHFSEVDRLEALSPTGSPALVKAYATVVHLRMLARKLVAQNQIDDISEYYIALFCNALNTLRFYSLPAVQREHALLCSSLLADRLGLKG